MTDGPDRRYIFPLCKNEDEDLDHFLQKCPVLLDLQEIYLHGIDFMLPGILQNSNLTTIFWVEVYIDKSLIRRRICILWEEKSPMQQHKHIKKETEGEKEDFS